MDLSKVDFPFPSSPIIAILSFLFSVNDKFCIKYLSFILILKSLISNILCLLNGIIQVYALLIHNISHVITSFIYLRFHANAIGLF